MDDLEITISHDGVERSFPLNLIKWGYTYRVQITIDSIPVLFEPDEEGKYRAVIEDGQAGVNQSLLMSLAEKLESLRE